MLRECPAGFTDRVIHGDRFAAIADVEVNRRADGTDITREMARLGRGARIVFVKTDLLPPVFAWLSRIPTPQPFVLVTHNSDRPITRRLFERAPPCVAVWYAVNVDHDAPRLVPVPSGMERPDGGGYSADYSMVPAAWRRSGQAPRRHLAFGCWSPGTNAKDRRAARQAFEGRAGFAWRDPGLSHEEFLRTCGESQFVISPPGNGIDCHRTWEALYMGAIPIVRRSPHTRAFAELPMVAVDDWSSLTDDALADLYAQFRRRTWNLERLFFPYWETRIRRDAAML